MSFPRSVCFVTTVNVLDDRRGDTEYLLSAVRLCRSQKIRTCLLIARADLSVRIVNHELLESCDAVHVYRSQRRGNAFVTVSPAVAARDFGRRLQRRLQRLIRQFVPAARPAIDNERGMWRLPPLASTTGRWAGQMLNDLQPDLIVANYYVAADVFEQLSGPVRKAILVHDVMALRAASFRATGQRADVDARIIAQEEDAFRRADLCFAIKDAEAAHIRSVAPRTTVRLLPHTVPVPDYPLGSPRAPVCLFVGSWNPVNVDGVDWLLREIWPLVRQQRPDAQLRVAGRVCERVTAAWPEGAAAVGAVPDLSCEYATAAVALIPLRYGSGLKVKLVEALAAGLPVVSTTSGADGIADTPVDVLAIKDTPDAFAHAIIARLADPDPAHLRHAARAFAAAHYAPDAVAQRALADLG